MIAWDDETSGKVERVERVETGATWRALELSIDRLLIYRPDGVFPPHPSTSPVRCCARRREMA